MPGSRHREEVVMSLSAREQHALDCIGDELSGTDPKLASMLTAFTRLTAGEEMPTRESIRPGRAWRTGRRRDPHRAGGAVPSRPSHPRAATLAGPAAHRAGALAADRGRADRGSAGHHRGRPGETVPRPGRRLPRAGAHVQGAAVRQRPRRPPARPAGRAQLMALVSASSDGIALTTGNRPRPRSLGDVTDRLTTSRAHSSASRGAAG